MNYAAIAAQLATLGVGVTSGIGYYILEAQRTFKVPRMYAGMLVLTLLGFTLNRCFLFVDPRLMAWHRRLTVG